MFTGIIQQVAHLEKIIKNDKGQHLIITCDPDWLKDTNLGNSISVNGICLSIEAMDNQTFTVYCIHQTLNKTNLRDLKKGDILNLEKALTLKTLLNGHCVLGHIDGLGELSEINILEDGTRELIINLAPSLIKYCIDQGSITLNGVSLTLAKTMLNSVKVSLIPITLKETNFSQLKVGNKINVEVDILGKYIEKLFPNTQK